MACPALPSLNDTIGALTGALNTSANAPWVQDMYQALFPTFSSSGAAWLQPLVCGGQLSNTCVALCPNQDLAGIGVRVAFYFQSFVTALLVVFSPTDSVPTAWAGTLLTASLIVAAMVSKAAGNLTLHHATLVLNFATLSCISSLAVAPMLPIWRLTPEEYFEQERQRHALILTEDGNNPGDLNRELIEASMNSNVRKRQVKRAQRRARMVLSLAILIQVVLQWAWGIMLFVSWNYNQPECNANTTLLIFFAPFKTLDINSVEKNGIHFFIWPVWLMFCLGITFALTVVLALSSSDRAMAVSSAISRADISTRRSSSTPAIVAWKQIARDMVPSLSDIRGQFYFWCNFVSFALWVMFVASSEAQKRKNCIFDGEDDFGGLGQITAVGVSIVPLWSLAVALYKYPEFRRKQRQHLAHATGQASQSHDSLPTTAQPPTASASAVRAQSVGYQPRHVARPSDASSGSSGEEHELQPLASRWRGARAYSPVPSGNPSSSPPQRRPTGPRAPPQAPRRRHTFARSPSGSGMDHATL